MATLTDGGFPTIHHVLSRSRPDGSIEPMIAELLTKDCPLLEDIPWKQGNLDTGHLVTAREALPVPTWRELNKGLDPQTDRTAQYVEVCGRLEQVCMTDVGIANLHGNPAAFRATYNKSTLQAFSEEIERALFYQSILTNPEKIHGLAPRYAATSGYKASSYVLKKGTVSGSNAESVWLINWDPDKLCGIYPKHSQGGFKHTDFGEEIVVKDGKQMRAYRDWYEWHAGFSVEDYRYAVRMQWDPDDTTTFPDTGKNFYLALLEMIDTVKSILPTARFYMSRKSRTKLNAQLAANSANYLEYVELNKRRVPTFNGVPIRVSEKLVGETAIT